MNVHEYLRTSITGSETTRDAATMPTPTTTPATEPDWFDRLLYRQGTYGGCADPHETWALINEVRRLRAAVARPATGGEAGGLDEVGGLPNSGALYRKPNGVGGHVYWSDEIGGGVVVWDTSLVADSTLLAALTAESRRYFVEKTTAAQPPAAPVAPAEPPRYFVDVRGGCIAVRDRTRTDTDYQGFYESTQGVMWFKMGAYGVVSGEWVISAETVAEAHRVCHELNNPLAPDVADDKRLGEESLAATIRALKFPSGASDYDKGCEDGFYRGTELAARLVEGSAPPSPDGAKHPSAEFWLQDPNLLDAAYWWRSSRLKGPFTPSLFRTNLPRSVRDSDGHVVVECFDDAGARADVIAGLLNWFAAYRAHVESLPPAQGDGKAVKP